MSSPQTPEMSTSDSKSQNSIMQVTTDGLGKHAISWLHSGTTVHTWSVSSRRAIVILQHGYGEYAERYVKGCHGLIPALNQQGFEVRAMDLYGHGRSKGVRGVTHVGKCVQDHVELRLLAKKEGLPVFVIGHSLGGLVTAGSVVAGPPEPHHIQGVILMSPAIPRALPWFAERSLRMLSAIIPTTSIFLPGAPFEGRSRLPEQLQEARADAGLTTRQFPYLLACTALQVGHEIDKGAGNWTAPTLAIHGTSDVYTDPAETARLIGNINSSDKKLKLFQGGYHELLNDCERNSVLGLVLGWLEEHCN